MMHVQCVCSVVLTPLQFKLKEREEEIRLLRKAKQDLMFRVQVCACVIRVLMWLWFL